MTKDTGLPEGYKQTEVGVIPGDWEVKPISEIIELMTNGFVGTVKSHYVDYDNGILYIQGYNVEENSFNFNGIKRVNHEFHKQHSKSCLQEGDLLTIQTGDIGVTTVVPKELVGANCHALIITRFKKETADPRFYSYYFNFSYGRNRLKEIETGSTMKHINVGDMIQMLIPYPTRAEQNAIATALYDADALITQLEKLIAKKRDIKQGAMQQLLTGKKRLPGFGGEWEVKKLGGVSEMYSGGTPLTSNNSYYGGQIPWVVIADMTRIKKYLFKTEKNITELGLQNSSTKLFKKGTLLFAMYASIGKCAIAKVDITCNQAILGINTKKIDTEFLYYYLTFNEQKFLQMGQTGTQNNLNKEIVQNLDIPYPSTEEQTAIATILSDMDAEIEALEQKRDKYKAVKQGMMQELLTGKTRLV